MKKIMILITIAFFGILYSCNIIEDVIKPNKLGGSQSPIGEVGNKLTISSSVTEIGNLNAEVTSLNDGVSSVTISMDIKNEKAKEIAKAIPDLSWNGDKVSVTRKYRVTDEGIQSVHDEGDLTMVKYDAKIGDSYSLKMNGNTVKRTVEYKSVDDEYPYGFYDIKVMKVKETGRGLPGVSNLEYVLNHRFGLVGIVLNFEDGSSKTITIYSTNEN
jgi:hypothetical protein